MAIFYLYIFLAVASTSINWFMQLVHYPLMPFVENAKWADFMQARQKFMTVFLYPLMAADAFAGLSLLIVAQQTRSYPLLVASVILLICLVAFYFTYLQPKLKKISGPAAKEQYDKFMKAHLLYTWGYFVRFLLIVLILLASV